MQTIIKKSENMQSPGDFLRFWRKQSRISQLDLALDIGVSSKHLSFVETGKSRPSRDLILKIAHSLKIPPRHQNAFLKTAGYSAEFGEEPFNSDKMSIVRQALQRMLDHHEPYPAMVINTSYKILMKNKGYDDLIRFYLGNEAVKKYDNSLVLLFDHNGLWQYTKQWAAAKQFILGRLWEEIVTTQNNDLLNVFKQINKQKTEENHVEFNLESNLPFITLTFEKDSKTVNLFTTITTLGTPMDLTTQELRIELLFPADEHTKEMFPLEK